MKKILQLAFLLILLATGTFNTVSAEDTPTTIHLTLRAGEVFFSENVPLHEDSTALSILEAADTASDIFTVSDIQEYPFGSYLKCIDIQDIGEKCDDWQYTVDGNYPSTSIDQTTLSGAGSMYFYFSAKNRISLSNDSITTSDTLVVTAEIYDYENGEWLKDDEVTIGITQPDTSGSFNPPTEIMKGEVDDNGEISFSSIPVGNYDVGIRDEYGYYFPTKPLEVKEAPQSPGGGSSSGSRSKLSPGKNTGEVLGAETKATFDLKKALDFLVTQQKENGSFEEDLYTDWVSLALAPANYQSQIIKLVRYFGELKIKDARLTDFERHAMALMALGLNPYNTNGENYIGKIVASFDGKQFGETTEDNDDIFALIVLNNAGYKPEEKMITDDLNFVLGRQRDNGSWDESVDMTGAGIEALSLFKENEKVKDSLIKAKDFLKKNQKSNGGWGDSASSTAWVIGGILALGEKPEDWKKGENSPLDYLTTLQDTDGGIRNENLKNKIWETAYVASALSGKTWDEIMQNFAKPEKMLATETPKEIVKKPAPQKMIVKTDKINTLEDNSKNLNSTTTESVVANPLIEAEKETPEQGWFARLLGNIFGF